MFGQRSVFGLKGSVVEEEVNTFGLFFGTIRYDIAMLRHLLLLAVAIVSAPQVHAVYLPTGFHRGPHFRECVREQWIESDVRVVVNLNPDLHLIGRTRLIIYATPNGNSIEWTLGCGKAPQLDWHYDIQHVAAQVRRLRELLPNENIALACIEPEGLSWPAWRKKHADAPARARRVVNWICEQLPGDYKRVALTGHSGGGSFTWAFLDGADDIPDLVERIALLDSNYSYDDEKKHGDKIVSWLQGDAKRRLSVIAYDDREITLNGKKVVGPDGGTYRATQRMMTRLTKDIALNESKVSDFINSIGLDGRLAFRVHQNPANKILHTALVGDMNGLLQGLTEGEAVNWGTFGGPRAYTNWIQPAPGIPPRPENAIGGRAFMQSIQKLSRDDCDEAIAAEILRGNIPEFLRTFCKVESKSDKNTATFNVMPDYLSIGSNADHVRVPMNPQTAQRIADGFGCALPARKMVDEIYRQSSLKLEPIPLTEAREDLATFIQHHDLIEKQRAGNELGQFVGGIKKDVVVTNKLSEKPNRVALYGWHKLDGNPIQPLTNVHVDWYVDYSHGVRLIDRKVMVNGKPRDIRHVMQNAETSGLLSDEGPILRPSY